MSIEQIVDAFFIAIQRGDSDTLQKIYHDDAQVWHNFTGATQGKSENIPRLVEPSKIG